MENRPIIVIAEDDPDDQFLIRDAMQAACPPDTEAHYVEDGVELMEFLQENHGDSAQPGLLVLDLNMPRKDGRLALQELKANPKLADIPVAILTTSNRDEDISFCQAQGIAGYYRKPGSMAELREIFRRLCAEYLG